MRQGKRLTEAEHVEVRRRLAVGETMREPALPWDARRNQFIGC